MLYKMWLQQRTCSKNKAAAKKSFQEFFKKNKISTN